MSFIHLGFLFAGLAVAVPIVIHLLFRQRTRDVPIGSIRFLHQVVKEHRRRRWVRQWLLLALRMLVVLLLAMLFARPFWDQSLQKALEREVVILIDRSASMSASGNDGKTALAAAIEQARQELQDLPPQVIVHVAICDATAVQEIPVGELPKTSASEAATDHGLAIEWARDLLQQSKRKQREILFFTDLQQSGLVNPPQPLPEGMQLQIRDVGQSLPNNLAVVAATATRTEIVPDQPLAVRAIIRNFSPLPARGVVVRCDLTGPRGKLEVQKEIDVTAQGLATVELPMATADDGVYRGHVEILTNNTGRRDSLVIDNRRWLAFEARHPERVLLVDGQEGRSVFQNETYYLETALRLRSEEGGQLRSFEPERIVWENGSGFPRLDGYRALVLANVRRYTDDDAARLKEYVVGGGNVLIFAGDQVTQTSLSPLQAAELLPGEPAANITSQSLRVTKWATEHPALALFSDPQRGDLRRIQAQKSLPLRKLTSGATPLLEAGDIVLAAEHEVGKGRVIYVGVTADRDWTELPQSRLYVPLVRQWLAHLTNQLADRRLVEEQLVTRTHPQSGIVEHEGKWLVTNLDPRESNPERITAERLQELAGGKGGKNDGTSEQSALALLLPADALRPDEIWTAIAWILLLVLAAETLLAGRVHA